MDILQTENLTKYYGEEPLVVKALDGINLQIEQGSFTAIVGTSGSGKSTLLHMLGGLDTPTGGSVVVDGQSLGKMSRSELTIFRRRKIGFIFQNYNLIPNLNIYDNIVLPVELDGRSADRQYLDNIISVLGLDGKLDRKPNKLSGGQQQRAAIARALITKPALILADEPTGNLDSRTSQEVVGLLQATGRQFHQTIVMITHNDEIAQIADRTIRIEDGRIAEGRWQG
ncbi:MAG: ABC transporter ATP-binding protein [Dorea sp.]|jgi:putative ABC transport system ATP-binding protein|nr:ABC transporter ATP-binding protein [Dorea sp.]